MAPSLTGNGTHGQGIANAVAKKAEDAAAQALAAELKAMRAHEAKAQSEADARYAGSLCTRVPSMDGPIKSVQVGAPFRSEPVCETERFRAEVRSLGCIAEPFATGTCASLCARVHVHVSFNCVAPVTARCFAATQTAVRGSIIGRPRRRLLIRSW